MKNVLVINIEFPPVGGGASAVSRSIAYNLADSGEFNVDIVTMKCGSWDKNEYIKNTLRVHRVWAGRNNLSVSHPWQHVIFLFNAYFKCRNLLKNNKFDVIHAHFIVPSGLLALLLSWQLKIPYVISAHGSDVVGYNKRFRFLYPLISIPWKWVINNASTVIAPSRFLQNRILAAYGKNKPKNIKVIPHGLEPVWFDKVANKRNIIFASGRLQKAKKFDVLINAVSDIDIGYELHIAGDGPEKNNLLALAKDSNTKVVFHGWLDNLSDAYQDLIFSANIFVSMSEYESFGMAILEAMAAKCAVITTAGTGIAELVGDSAVLVTGTDVLQLQSEILDLVDNPVKMTKYQRLAHERSHEFKWARVINKYKNTL